MSLYKACHFGSRHLVQGTLSRGTWVAIFLFPPTRPLGACGPPAGGHPAKLPTCWASRHVLEITSGVQSRSAAVACNGCRSDCYLEPRAQTPLHTVRGASLGSTRASPTGRERRALPSPSNIKQSPHSHALLQEGQLSAAAPEPPPLREPPKKGM